ncbi:MAG: hypothetical protein ACK5ZT_08075, partial [Sphingobacteriaceae bacterium]
MIKPTTIPQIVSDEITDFEALFKEGISLLQQFSGDVWTDYNEHDPGVTILENLCYVITDLYDRTDIPIKNLLTEENGVISLEKNALYSATDILLNGPLTPTDYRKIIIDRINKVNNAWILPYYGYNETLNKRFGIAGMYEVLIDLQEDTNKSANKDEIKRDGAQTKIISDVNQVLNANRKVAEFFPKITILDQKAVVISAVINLKESTNPEKVLAQILFNIKHFIKPEIEFYTYDELIAKGYTTEEIFDGPKLNNGFVPANELNDKVNTLYRDALLKLIIQNNEVTSVESLTISIDSTHIKDTYTIPHTASLVLDLILSLDNITIHKQGTLYEFNSNLVVSLFNELQGKKKKSKTFKYTSDSVGINPPLGEYVNPSEYYSLQNDFPRIYSIGQDKLSRKAKDTRKAQVLQLKSYLLFYEQILADAMMQTANLKELFSINEQDRTYFYQTLYNVPDAPPLFKGFEGSADEIFDTTKGHIYKNH